MHFVLQTPSLKHLAGMKTVTQLWNQPDIFVEIVAESFYNFSISKPKQRNQKWKKIEEKMTSNILALSLPETCKEELVNFIKPIGKGIIDRCYYHDLDCNLFKVLHILLTQQLCWSMHGTVDYAKTAESMMKNERLSVERRFEFACLNCLEDEARELLEFISNHRIHKYIAEAVKLNGYRSILNQRILIAYFTCTLSGDVDLLDRLFQAMDSRDGSVNKQIFKVVLDNGPRATCDYFIQKVSQQEKEQVCSKLVARRPRTWSRTCGLMYWLSLLNEHKPTFPKLAIAYILMRLLIWPRQSLFMAAAECGWQWMNKELCAVILRCIIIRIRDGYRDFDYAQLFWKYWRLSPEEHKQHFLNDSFNLETLFATKRKEFILLGLNQAPELFA